MMTNSGWYPRMRRDASALGNTGLLRTSVTILKITREPIEYLKNALKIGTCDSWKTAPVWMNNVDNTV